MSGSQITTNVTLTVTLGNASYPSPLTITSSGSVAPTTYGSVGVLGTAAAGLSLDNLGTIAGALGGQNGFSGVGGTGLLFGGGSASNAGRIGGGVGTLGGIGVALATAGTLFNTTTGAIGGGASGGGSVYDSGGAGVTVAADATLMNAGLVTGGTGATGEPAGRVGKGGTGGAGVASSGLGAMITNTDLIIGGSGGGGDDAYAGNGGAGAALAGGSFVNEGTVQGGGGGYGGSGSGGTGLTAGNGVNVDNAGTILGGNGAPGSFSPYYNQSFGGSGGTGVSLTGGTLLDTGFIGGGDGANNPEYPGGAGGGVALDGGVLIAAGTVAGGVAGGLGNSVGTTVGPAVVVAAGTLVVMPGAVFEGTVSAAGATGSELVFATSPTAIPLASLGTEFVGFATIDLEASPSLTLAGSYSTGAFLIIGNQATLDSAATLTGGVALGTAGSLQSTGRIVGLTAIYGDGTLDRNGGAGITLAASAQAVSSGLIAGGDGGREPSGYVGRYGGAGVAPNGGIGAVLAAGASLTNQGTLAGGAAGYFSVSGQSGTAGQGAVLASGALLINQGSLSGGIAGASTGAVAAAGVAVGDGSLVNSGTIVGGASFGSSTVVGGGAGAAGVALTGGSFANTGFVEGGLGAGSFSSTVAGGSGGSALVATGGVITNGGTLLGGGAGYDGNGVAGASLTGATLTNTALIGGGSGGEATGSEIGGTGGAGVTLADATLINTGTIAAGFGGFEQGTLATGGAGGSALIATAGVVVNSGTLLAAGGGSGQSGTDGGVGAILTGATLTNSGRIVGGNGGFAQTGAGGIGGAGAALTNATLFNAGNIFGGSSGSRNPASGEPAGAAGAGVTVGGGLLTNDGTITGGEGFGVAGGIGVYLDGGTVIDAGSIIAGRYGKLVNGTPTYISGDAILFGTLAGTLVLESSGVLSGTIGNFAPGDTIDLAGFVAQSSSFNSGTLSLTDSQGASVTLDLPSETSLTQFAITPDGADGTDVTAPCYANGTRIATTRGLVPVEHLATGDHVLLARGGTAEIRWLGHRRVNCAAHSDPESVMPVRIRAHAFAPGMPGRDLWLSPDHAVFADGVLVPIKHLINGRSIAPVAVEAIDYWHVELDRHDVLLAEGLPAESYLDTGNRLSFANGRVVGLRPDFTPRSWSDACAELVQDGPRVVDLKRRLFVRAGGASARGGSGFSVSAGRRVLFPLIGIDGLWRYDLPPGVRVLRLNATQWMPAAHLAESLDRRMIGVRVFSIAVDGVALDLECAALTGFHPVETTPEGRCRWTSGDAQIALPAGARTIAMRVGDAAVPQIGQAVQAA